MDRFLSWVPLYPDWQCVVTFEAMLSSRGSRRMEGVGGMPEGQRLASDGRGRPKVLPCVGQKPSSLGPTASRCFGSFHHVLAWHLS